MSYHVGDKVAHPGHGGCTIKEICTRSFGGEDRRYFVLVPQTDPHTTILAPVENVDKIGLREVISVEDADQILSYFSSPETVDWVTDHAKRRQAYESTLKSGTLTSLAKMVKELKTHETQSKLNNVDRELLPKAQRKLFSEIALAKGIDFDRALCLAGQKS